VPDRAQLVKLADAEAYEALTLRGLACDLALRDEPSGQRRFGVVDPSGMWLDVVEQTQPEPGWWEENG